MTSMLVLDYRPDAALDTDLADLCYAALFGWPDQRPVTPALVRAWLRPAGTTATTLALHRGHEGRLLGAAAVCWPATPDPPVGCGVRWCTRTRSGGGVGSALLGALLDEVVPPPARDPGDHQ